MDYIYEYKHYIRTRDDNAVLELWSDGPLPDKETTDAICINEHGSYQPTIHGHTITSLYNMDAIPLYKWDGADVVERTAEEIEEERRSIPEPGPSEQDDIEGMLIDHEYRLTLIELGLLD